MGLDTQPQSLLVLSLTLLALDLIAVALRFTTRYIQRQPLGIDDWLMLPAMV